MCGVTRDIKSNLVVVEERPISNMKTRIQDTLSLKNSEGKLNTNTISQNFTGSQRTALTAFMRHRSQRNL